MKSNRSPKVIDDYMLVMVGILVSIVCILLLIIIFAKIETHEIKSTITESEILAGIDLLIFLTIFVIIAMHFPKKLDLNKKENTAIQGSLQKLRMLISSDNLEEAFDELKIMTTSSKFLNELILHEARFSELKDQIRIGIIPSDYASIRKAKLRVSLLEFIDKLEKLY